ncbi:MAG: TIR domain-containing protein [Gammaproteobacteria bacterium]|nr:TIR domain-containing protein [Gammaproteobacteria bacterium]
MSEIKVFISYSHDSDEHRKWVQSLSDRLREDGVETILDQYLDSSPAEGWPRWMMNGIEAADKVLCICTEKYDQRFRGHAPVEEGHGADWEGAIITQEIYDSKHISNTFIPILRSANDKEFVPILLGGQSRYTIDSETNYKALLDEVFKLKGVQPGRVGTIKSRSRPYGQSLRFNSSGASTHSSQNYNETSETPWFSIELTVNNNQLQATNDDGQTASMAVAELDTEETTKLARLSAFLFDNFKQLQADQATRLRIMTNDAVLGMLPWHQLPDPANGKPLNENGWVIETGPALGRSYQRCFQTMTLHSPLLVIPEQIDGLGANNHYSIVQSHLEAYLKIYGPMPRITELQFLKQELNHHQPDLLYLCLHFDGTQIHTSTTGANNHSDQSYTLDTLAHWLEETGLQPVVILNLIGQSNQTLSDYPSLLIKHSRLLWVQATGRQRFAIDLQQHFATVLQQTTQQPDFSALITRQQHEHRQQLQNLIWLNGLTPILNSDTSAQQQQQQIRAALLKVLLGRNALKNQMAGAISHALNQNTPIINYAISGERSTCPHDVPDQIKHRLMWSSSTSNLTNITVMSYYLPVQLTDQSDLANTIDKTIGESLLCGNDNVETIFRQQLEQRGLSQQPSCISLNWLFQIDDAAAESIETWLQEWGLLVYEELRSVRLDNCIIVNAVCLEITTNHDAQQLHDKANRVLRQLRNHQYCRIEPTIVKDALDKLDSGEIEDFLENQQGFWRQQLQLDDYQIESPQFADWLIDKTRGRFEDTVQLIWQQYRSNYQGFLKHE